MDAPQSPLLRARLDTSLPRFVRGEGVELIDDAGRRYLDAASGVGVTCLGYGRADIAEAMARQATMLPYVHALRFESEPARRLAEEIVALAPGDLSTVFFTSGGAEANEAAFKLARQYQVERGEPQRWRIVGRHPSFHGNTLATLAAGGHAGRRARYEPMLPAFSHVPAPNTYRGCTHCGGSCDLHCADRLDGLLTQDDSIAAFIAEPVVGASGGALAPPDGYFARIGEICSRHGVLLIADEVITGFGRTGTAFGIGHFGVVPDILTFAKGVAAGYAPLGGMIAGEHVVAALRAGSGRFEHSLTMSGHPVACAAGLATLDALRREHLIERVNDLSPVLFEALRRHLRGNPVVGDIRGIGLLAGIELVADQDRKMPFSGELNVAGKAETAAREERVLVYAGHGDPGDYLLLMPPFVSTRSDLEAMAAGVGRGLSRLAEQVMQRVP
ncbi:MAG TPA: aspartate aminotransferase family protein [Chloroflexota bacterium]|nr:aspartate aminotransferase family protein [Chloroflexota bacterium]